MALSALIASAALLLLALLAASADAITRPPVIRLALYQNFYVSALIGTEGSERRLRVRFDEDKFVVYGAPSGGTYDSNTGKSFVSLGPLAANISLPIYYTYQGDGRVSDPITTNQRVSYSGVLGLGPASPLWLDYQYDSWRLERDWLVIGDEAPKARISLPSSVNIDPTTDFTVIRDLATYLRWLSTVPGGSPGSNSNETLESALSTLRQAGAGTQMSAAEELAGRLRIYSRKARAGWSPSVGYPSLDSAMVLGATDRDSEGVEIDTYTVDSTSGFYIQMVRYDPPRAVSNFSSLARRTRSAPVSATSSFVLTVGLLHAADHTIFGTADLSTVFLSPSPAGPFRSKPSDYDWLCFACFALALILAPGIAERFQRARRLFMPLDASTSSSSSSSNNGASYLQELAKLDEDWTYYLLLCRFVLGVSVWILHMSLATYRSFQTFSHRGWYIAYYVPLGYMAWHVIFGAVRYLDRHSVVRYSIALQLSSVLLLSNGYESVIRLVLMLGLSFNCARLACDKFFSSLIRPDAELDSYARWRVNALALTEAVGLAWFFGFYVLDHAIYQVNRHTATLVVIELAVVTVGISSFSLAVCVSEEVVRIRANVAHLAGIVNGRLTERLSARRDAQAKLASEPQPQSKAPGVAHSGARILVPEHFHFGMSLGPIDPYLASLQGLGAGAP